MAPPDARAGPRVSIAFATFLVVAIWIAAFAGTVRAVGKPYPGFGFTADLVVTTLLAAQEEGLRQFDQVVALDGIKVGTSREVERLLAERAPGAQLEVAVLRDGRPATARVALGIYTWADWLHVGPVLLAALLHLLVGVVVAWLRPRSAAARALFLLTAGVAAGLATGTDIDTGRSLPPVLLASNFLFASGAVHLALVFPVPGRWLRGLPRRELWLHVPVLAAGSATLLAGGHDRTVVVAIAQAIVVLQAAGCLVLLLGLVRQARGSYRIEREQARLALLGAGAAYGPFIGVWIVPQLFGLAAPAWLATASLFLIVLFPISIAAGIVRHRMFDIDVVIRRTAAYAATFAVLGGAYFVVAGGLRYISNRVFGATGELPGLAATAIIALAFAPVRDRAVGLMNRLYAREKYDFARVTSAFAAETRGAKDLSGLLDAFALALEAALGTREIVIFLREGKSLVTWHEVGAAADVRSLDHAPDDAAAVARAGVSFPDEALFPGDALHAPLVAGEDLFGLVALGRRASELPYGAPDRLLVANLTQQLSGAVQIAFLVEEVSRQERLERDVEIARDVQNGLLLAEIPDVPGFGLVAWTLPAYEIGGDFYDVLQVDGEHWGVFVGDVVGKGIPAALLAAATLSAFRAIAPGLTSPSEVLVRLNAFLDRYKPSRKLFVAAQYWVVAAGTGTVRVANAGQPLPLLNGRPVDLKGFPLGVDRRVRYREGTLDLAPGDALLGYSDGLEDIRDPQGEAFGLARVLSVAAACRDRGLAEVDGRLRATVEAFAAGRSRFDDITVVGLRRKAR